MSGSKQPEGGGMDPSSSVDEVIVKRRRMMQCLQEIQSLVEDDKTSKDKDKVLSTLQSVVSHIRNLRDKESDAGHKRAVFQKDSCSNFSRQRTSGFSVDIGFYEDSSLGPKFQGLENLSMGISCSKRTITEVSAGMMSFLGYSQSAIYGKPFHNFIHERDVLTFGSSISALNNARLPAGNTCEKTVSFFMRLWHNNSRLCHLNSARARCSVMFSTVQIQYNSEKSSSTSSKHKSDNIEHELSDSVYSALQSSNYGSMSSSLDSSMAYIINCSPMHSAYKSCDRLPNQLSFSYKHSQSCVFTYIDACAIPLLGYLPQDIVGKSIFQYYHPDDLSILLSAYNNLSSTCSKSKCSQPVRLKVQNGEYITVDTELSCFINPWSNLFDFVTGKHSVVRGPGNLDVFAQFESNKILVDVFPEFTAEHLIVQNSILDLLSRRLGDKSDMKPKKFINFPSTSAPLAEKRSSPHSDSNNENKTADESQGDSSTILPLQSASYFSKWDQQEIYKVYNSLAYLQGIKRLLASQYGPEEGGVRFQIPATHTLHRSVGSDDDDGSQFPEPPSHPTSSTKAMVLEDLDQQMPSPQEADTVPQNGEHMANLPDLRYIDQVESHVQELTMENVQVHEQLQRTYYLQSLLKDKEMKLFYETVSVPKLMRNLRNRLRKRRATSGPVKNKIHDEETACKVKKYDDDRRIAADFPITSINYLKRHNTQPVQPCVRPQPHVGRSLLHTHHPMHMAQFNPVPVLSAAPLYGYSSNQFRYGTKRTYPSNFGLTKANNAQTATDSVRPLNLMGSVSEFSSALSVSDAVDVTKVDYQHMRLPSASIQSPAVLTKPLSIQVPQTAADMRKSPIPENTLSTTPILADVNTEYGEESTSSACIFDSSCTDDTYSSEAHDVPDENQTRLPFWLEDPLICTDKLMNYEVKLTPNVELERFQATLAANPQATQVCQQLLEFQLEKLDLDLEEDSDCSSLFTPVKANTVAQKWAQKSPVTNNAYLDADTDSSENVVPQKRRKSRTKLKPCSASARVASYKGAAVSVTLHEEQERDDDINDKVVMDAGCVEKGESEDGKSLASLGVKSNGCHSVIYESARKWDTTNRYLMNTSSPSIGYQGSAELTSNDDANSTTDSSDCNFIRQKISWNLEKKHDMDPRVALKINKRLNRVKDYPVWAALDQPVYTLDQFDALLQPCSREACDRDANLPLQQRAPNTYTEPAPNIQQQLSSTSPATVKRIPSQADSGFQTASTLSHESRLYRSKNGNTSRQRISGSLVGSSTKTRSNAASSITGMWH